MDPLVTKLKKAQLADRMTGGAGLQPAEAEFWARKAGKVAVAINVVAEPNARQDIVANSPNIRRK